MQSIRAATNKVSIWMYLLGYYLIIGSDCILFCFNRNEALIAFAQYVMVGMAIIFAGLALMKSRGRLKADYLFLFLTIIAILFTAIYYGEFSGGYISIIALLVLGRTFFDVIDPLKFKKVFLLYFFCLSLKVVGSTTASSIRDTSSFSRRMISLVCNFGV